MESDGDFKDGLCVIVALLVEKDILWAVEADGTDDLGEVAGYIGT